MNSAIDGTTAGNLQSQINELENNALTTENIDNSTIVFEPTTTSGGANRLQVNDLSIGTEHLKDKSVTQAKLGDDVASYIQNVVKPQPGKDIGAYSWQELIEMANDTDIELSDLDYLIGQSRNISITGYGTFAFQLIGIGHDSLASGGTSKLLTFQSIDIVCNHNMNSSSTTSGGWASSAMRTFMNGDLLSKFPPVRPGRHRRGQEALLRDGERRDAVQQRQALHRVGEGDLRDVELRQRRHPIRVLEHQQHQQRAHQEVERLRAVLVDALRERLHVLP